MTILNDLSVLIIDPKGEAAFGLRQSFVAAGAKTHVVQSLAAAGLLLDAKKIEAVVLPYSRDPETVAFCRLLAERNMPSVFTSEPPSRYPARRQMPGAIVALKGLVAEHSRHTYDPVN